MTAVLAACLVASFGVPQEEPADPFDWARALEELDLSLSFGDFSFEFGGELDVEVFVFGDEAPGVHVEDAALRSDHYKRVRIVDSPEVGGRLKLTMDGSYQSWLSYFVEGRIDHGAPFLEGEAVGARFEQYWLRATASAAFNFQVGKFAAPIGNFIPRHEPKKNPLTTFPLVYDQATTFMKKTDAPANVLNRRDVPDTKDWRVPIWQAVYGTGAMAFGTVGDFSWSAAAMNSAPGTWPFDWALHSGDFEDPNVYLHASWALDASATVGASWARGPYDREDVDGIPPGRDTGDFPQTLAGVDFQYGLGDLDLFAEVIWTRFETPNVDDLELWSWYVEGKYTILPGLFGAARLAQMIFGEIEDAAGESRQWDRNLYRVEFGGGYFFTHNLFAKVTAQLNYTSGGREPNDHLLMFQLGLGF